jgi:hypothetical protein
MWWFALVACQQPNIEMLVESDASREGISGSDGPFGAARLEALVAARVVEAVPTTVVVPLDAEGAPAAGEWPVVAFVQGGLVARERYLWLATHLATRGYVTVLPSHTADLAITSPDNAASVVRGLRDRPPRAIEASLAAQTPAAVAGHSLGGVIAVKEWLSEPELFDAVVLLASYPARGDNPSERAGDPVLSLVGSVDGSSEPERVREGAATFSDPVYFGLVDGLNHYGWTDDPTEEELAGDGTPGREVGEARRDALHVIDTFLDVTLSADVEAMVRLGEANFSGIAEEW